MEMDRYIGRLLDNRYEILEVIGTGGMAVVYKARCHRLNRLVAIKILRDEYSQDEEFRRRFHAEGQAVAMLSHPNIVSVYDVSTSDDADYIVMELIDGITLKQYMEKKKILNWKETLHFAIQIGKALDHAHSRGIIHRDIKPHNVMVLKNGSVKVADFGIAQVMSKSNTLTKEALGSVHYISPEQAKGGRVDNRSDLYSLGVVMYEMMTGRPPYDGDSPVSVAIQHINGKAPMPSTLNPNIPGGLEQIIVKAMSTDPADRYPTAAAMLADMDEFRKNPAILFDYNNPTTELDAAAHLHHQRQDPDETMPLPKTTAERVAGKTETPRPRTDRTKSRPAQQRNPRRREEIVEEHEERSKVATIAIVSCAVVAVAAIIVFAIAIASGSIFGSDDNLVAVPDLLGKTQEQVTELYPDIVIKIDEKTYDSQRAKGQIIEQRPSSGTKIAKGGIVTVTISLGPEPQTKVMEMLKDVPEQQAKDFLNNLKMDLKIISHLEASSTVGSGCVIRTDPEDKEELSVGQTVHLWISTGPEVKTGHVPNVKGRDKEMAVKILTNAGFPNVEFQSVDSDRNEGEVVEQSVPGGTQTDLNTIIVLSISNGKSRPQTEPPTLPPVLEGYVTKTVLLELPDEMLEDGRISIWYDGKMVAEQDAYAGTLSVEFKLQGKGTMSFQAMVDEDPKTAWKFDVNFDE